MKKFMLAVFRRLIEEPVMGFSVFAAIVYVMHWWTGKDWRYIIDLVTTTSVILLLGRDSRWSRLEKENK